jgi:hypothetical protein
LELKLLKSILQLIEDISEDLMFMASLGPEELKVSGYFCAGILN